MHFWKLRVRFALRTTGPAWHLCCTALQNNQENTRLIFHCFLVSVVMHHACAFPMEKMAQKVYQMLRGCGAVGPVTFYTGRSVCTSCSAELSFLALLERMLLKVGERIWRLQMSCMNQQWMKILAGEHILTENTVSVQDKAQCLQKYPCNCCYLSLQNKSYAEQSRKLSSCLRFWGIFLKQNSSTFVFERMFALV